MDDRGHIVIALLFLLLLSASGLALLTHGALHRKIIAARQDKRLNAAVLERALVLDLHRYRAKLAAADIRAYPEPESGFFNNGTFPDRTEDGRSCRHRFRSSLLRTGPDYHVVRVLDLVRTSRCGSQLEYCGRAAVDLLAGDIPAGELELLVRRESADPPDSFLAGLGVEYSGSQLPLVGKFPVVCDSGRLLSDSLHLEGEAPGWRRLREEFSLEPADAPLPRGIYLARDEEEVPAVFVQGDLEMLELGAGDGWQSITFCQEGRRDVLRYQPGSASISWSGAGDFGGLVFGEKIIVHGGVEGIGQVGAAALLPEARIELLACGRLVVRSGLESEAPAQAPARLPGLLLMTWGRDFFSFEAVGADVVIDVDGEAALQAQVIAAGTLANGNGRVSLAGSLCAGDVLNSGRLRVGAAPGRFSFADYVRLPDFKFLKNFRVHSIEEGSDEQERSDGY